MALSALLLADTACMLLLLADKCERTKSKANADVKVVNTLEAKSQTEADKVTSESWVGTGHEKPHGTCGDTQTLEI